MMNSYTKLAPPNRHQQQQQKPNLISKIYSNNNDEEVLNRVGCKKRRFRSWVWEYFIPSDRKTATCTICNKTIVHGHPTSHLINHLTKVHNLTDSSSKLGASNYQPTSSSLQQDHNLDQQQYELNTSGGGGEDLLESFDENGSPLNEGSNMLGASAGDLVESSASTFNSTTKTLIEFFISINKPFFVFDDFRLRSAIADINPNYTLPSSRVVECDYLPELVNFMEDEIRQSLAQVDYVALSTSSLKSNESIEYSVVFAHYIHQFEMKHRILSFQIKSDEQTSENLLLSLENDWNISNRISCIIDETSTSIKSSRYLTEPQHLPCAKSLINSCMSDLIDKPRESNSWVTDLVSKSKQFVTRSKQLGLINSSEAPSLSSSSPNNESSWLRIYHALNWIVQNNTDLLDSSLVEAEIEMIQSLVSVILEPISEIYDELINPTNVVAGFVFPAIYSLVNYELAAVEESSLCYPIAAHLIDLLKSRFDFVFDSESPLHKCFLTSTLLDCRFKQFQFVRNEQARFALLNRAKSSLVDFYTKINSSSKSPSNSSETSKSCSTSGSADRRKISFVEKMLNRFPKLEADNSFMSELDMYIGESCDSIQSPLEFYRIHEHTGKFPQFLKMASFFFSLPVVSVVPNDLVDYCNQMEGQGVSAQSLESLVFVKNNLNF